MDPVKLLCILVRIKENAVVGLQRDIFQAIKAVLSWLTRLEIRPWKLLIFVFRGRDGAAGSTFL